MLSVSENKVKLISLLKEHIVKNASILNGNLFITANESTPLQICGGCATPRHDKVVRHDEADTAIVHQLVSSESQKALILADDTDIFALLCHFVNIKELSVLVHMASMKSINNFSRVTDTLISINASVAKNKDLMHGLLAAHALTGCDTVASYHGIGKLKMLKSLETAQLDALGWYKQYGNSILLNNYHYR